VCSNDADCCPGSSCILAAGSSRGICGPCVQPAPDGGVTPDSGPPPDGGITPPPDAGKTCALYGQICTTTADCCNGVPCTGGRCEVPIQ
jgi:hypothetical protein